MREPLTATPYGLCLTLTNSMKSTKDFRPGSEDTTKKATKLEPIRKSGKERHTLFKTLDQDDEDAELNALRKRESILDYIDDGEEDLDEEDLDEDEFDDEDFDDEEFEEEFEEEEDFEDEETKR